jgi:hypothetical protein
VAFRSALAISRVSVGTQRARAHARLPPAPARNARVRSARKLFGRLLCEALPDCERPDLTAPEGEINVSSFSVDEVADWLEGEGFGDAKRKFAANTVDGLALLDLNEVRCLAERAATAARGALRRGHHRLSGRSRPRQAPRACTPSLLTSLPTPPTPCQQDELKGDLGVSKIGSRRRFARVLCSVMPGCKNPARKDSVAAWSAKEVSDWLTEIGLGKYAPKFVKNEVRGGCQHDAQCPLPGPFSPCARGSQMPWRSRLAAAPKGPTRGEEGEMRGGGIVQTGAEGRGMWGGAGAHGRSPLARTRARGAACSQVDGMSLPDITEEELKDELGVAEIGLRKRFRTRLCAMNPAFCVTSARQPRALRAECYPPAHALALGPRAHRRVPIPRAPAPPCRPRG